MEINQILAHGFQECLGALWLKEKHTDFTLKVQDTTFKCHRFVLSACSEVFRAMLDSDMRESQENSATIGDVDEDIFSTILHALYTGVDGLNEDNVYQIWLVVHQWQISHMVRCCEDFVIRNISRENYFKTYQHAKLLDSNSVLTEVSNFMIENFEVIRTPETLQALSPDEMYTILQSNDLKVHSEDSVVESIITWVKLSPNSNNLPNCSEAENASMHSDTSSQEIVVSGSEGETMNKNQQADDRAKHIKRLFSLTRLYLVSPKCLEKALRYITSLMYFPDVCSLLIDAIMYQQEVERRQFPWPTPAIHRATSDMEHVMVFWNSDKKEFQVYRLQNNAICNTSIGLPSKLNKCLGFCVYANHLYCSSFSDVSESSHVMTINKKEWISVYSVNLHGNMYARCSGDVRHVTHSGNVYRLDRACLERFSPKYGNGFVGNWERHCYFRQFYDTSSPMIVFRDSFIIFPLNNSDIVWVDLKLKKERKVTRIEGPFTDIVTFVYKDETYILQKNGFLRKIISPVTENLTFDFITELWTGEWKLRGALLFRGQLFVFGADLPQDAYAQIKVPSLKDVFESVIIVNIDSDFPCWPMVMPKSWLS